MCDHNKGSDSCLELRSEQFIEWHSPTAAQAQRWGLARELLRHPLCGKIRPSRARKCSVLASAPSSGRIRQPHDMMSEQIEHWRQNPSDSILPLISHPGLYSQIAVRTDGTSPSSGPDSLNTRTCCRHRAITARLGSRGVWKPSASTTTASQSVLAGSGSRPRSYW
jgi:hypothetical protein